MSENAATAVNPEPVSPVMADALAELERYAHLETDGIWLEDLTAKVAPLVRDWNVDRCWRWAEWPEREEVMPPGTPSVDVGIDLVARRRDDGRWIAIQVKSRKLDSRGKGRPVTSDEMNKFLSAAANPDIWAERWLIVNGAVRLGGHSPGKVSMSGAPVKSVNLTQAVESQRAAADAEVEPCPHCTRDSALTPPPPRRGRVCNRRPSRRLWRVCARTSKPTKTAFREARRAAGSCCPAVREKPVSH